MHSDKYLLTMGYKEQKQDKRRFPTWARGFTDKGKQRYHYYLEIGFKFDSEINRK